MALCSLLTREQSNALYVEVLKANDTDGIRKLCREDLFFLLSVACRRQDINRDWLYDRCREVEAAPDGFLDLWSREHYKSTIITYGKSIQDILVNPDITIGIFSHTRPIAKAFLDQIKREFEENEFLKSNFPDILYQHPKRESSSWSLDGGLLVKCRTNPKEKTIEAWGLVDGQPISKHYTLLVYDDVVTIATVNTPDQIKSTTKAFQISLNLGDTERGVIRGIGTRYDFNDPYRDIMAKETLTPRYHVGTDDGTVNGTPFLWTREIMQKKRRDMGPYVFACQILQNPKEESVMGFEKDWLRYYENKNGMDSWNKYILCDPAGDGKKKHSMDPDYTVILVVGAAPDGNLYIIDGIRDRINLTGRTKKLFAYHKQYKPLGVAYEKYGKDSDIEHIEEKMKDENYRFEITAVAGNMSKNDRIRKLVPDFEQSKIWLPMQMLYATSEGVVRDFVKEFIDEEYEPFPFSVHDDMLDCLARIKSPELNVVYPDEEEFEYESMTVDGGDVYMAKTKYNVLSRGIPCQAAESQRYHRPPSRHP